MKKRNRVYIKLSYTTKLPKQISNDELEILVSRLRRLLPRIMKEAVNKNESKLIELTKERTEIEHKIILGHLRLGVAIALDKITNVDREDLIGEMELAITKAVREAGRGRLNDNDITAYIISYIKYYLSEFIKSDRLVGVPPRTIRHWNQFNKVKKLPVRIDISEDNETDDLNQFVKLSEFLCVPKVHLDTSEMEIREILDLIANNDLEKRIIELRLSQYTYEEIEKIIGYSKTRIQVLISNIEKKFDQFMKEAK